MEVKHCMNYPVELVRSDSTVRDAAERMSKYNLGLLPVEENDRLVGMITDRDIVIRCLASGFNPESTSVKDAMTKAVYYCFEDEELDEVAKSMSRQAVRRMPVLNRNKRLIGLISISDLARAEYEATGKTLKKISDRAFNYAY